MSRTTILLLILILPIVLQAITVQGSIVSGNKYGIELVIVKPGVTINYTRLRELWTTKYVKFYNITIGGSNYTWFSYYSLCNRRYGFIVGYVELNASIYPVFIVKPLFTTNISRYTGWKGLYCIEVRGDINFTGDPGEWINETLMNNGWSITRYVEGYIIGTQTPGSTSSIVGAMYDLWLYKAVGNYSIYGNLTATVIGTEIEIWLRLGTYCNNTLVMEAIDSLTEALNLGPAPSLSKCGIEPTEEWLNMLDKEIDILLAEISYLIDIGVLNGFSKADLEHIELGAEWIFLNGTTAIYDGEKVIDMGKYMEMHGITSYTGDNIINITPDEIGYLVPTPDHPCVYYTTTPQPNQTEPSGTSGSTTSWLSTAYNTNTPMNTSTTTSASEARVYRNIEYLIASLAVALAISLVVWFILTRR